MPLPLPRGDGTGFKVNVVNGLPSRTSVPADLRQ